MMYFDYYVYGNNIRVETKDFNGDNVIVRDDTSNGLPISKGQNIFIVGVGGATYTGVYKTIDENGYIITETGISFNPKMIVFMGWNR